MLILRSISYMNEQKMKKMIQDKLTKARYNHTIRVLETAINLAKKHNVSLECVTKAALFHDFFKDESEQKLKQKILYYELPKDLLTYNKELWHGPVGAVVAREKYNVNDDAIFNAIYYHTT